MAVGTSSSWLFSGVWFWHFLFDRVSNRAKKSSYHNGIKKNSEQKRALVVNDIILVINLKRLLNVIKEWGANGHHATLCMPGCEPNHG